MKLFDTTIKAAKPLNGRRRKLADGHGLYLYVTSTSKTWIYRFSWRAKQQEITLGPYPLISLGEARDLRNELRKLVLNGIDPRTEFKRGLKGSKDPTFEEISEEFFSSRSQWSSSHLKKTRNRLAKDAYVAFGSKLPDQIATKEIVAVLRKVESRTVADSARKLLTVINQIFEFAKGAGYCKENPAREIGLALRRPTRSGYNFVSDQKRLGQILNVIDNLDCDPVLKTLAQIQPLVWCRPGELRKTLWSEVDFENSQIVIPKERIKRGVQNDDLIIPLSHQVVELLSALKPLTGHTPYVFVSQRRDRLTNKYKPFSDQALSKALKTGGICSSEQHPHGFRKTASTLLNGLGVNKDWIEVQLHHVDQSSRGTYNKAIYLEQRHQMMQQYADILDKYKSVEIAERESVE